MTKEERDNAINFLKGYLDEDVYTEKCINAHTMAIKSLEQQDILDKIKAEIDLLSDSRCDGTTITIYSWNGMKRRVLEIIDKYKEESEE